MTTDEASGGVQRSGQAAVISTRHDHADAAPGAGQRSGRTAVTSAGQDDVGVGTEVQSPPDSPDDHDQSQAVSSGGSPERYAISQSSQRCVSTSELRERLRRSSPPIQPYAISQSSQRRVTTSELRGRLRWSSLPVYRSNRHGVSKMRRKWSVRPEAPEDLIVSAFCCKKLQCFQNCNLPFLREKMTEILALSTSQRRQVLHGMLGSGKEFHFDGRKVCTSFLLGAFRFSNDLISSVRNNVSRTRTPSSIGATEPVPGQLASAAPSVNTGPESHNRDSIRSFLERTAESTGDMMPDNNEYHLPFYKKNEVYDEFKSDFKFLYPSRPIPSYPYFVTVWNDHCSFIKVRKFRRFAKCTTCEDLRTAIKQAIREKRSTKELVEQKRAHLSFIARERLEYKKKRDMSKQESSRYLSLIIDGADQSAFGLPHFTVKTKSQTGHAIKVRLIGILEHAVQNKLILLTMTDDFESGANHIIEALHVCLNDHDGDIPSTIYIQLDNCGKENKNRFLFSFLEFLVCMKVCKVIEVGFLPVGHTHEDIDQAFSCTAERLRSNDAVTRADLHCQLEKVYNNRTVVREMKSIVNWSGLCSSEKCLSPVSGFSHYRYFRFSTSTTDTPSWSGTKQIPVQCFVKMYWNDEWKNLHGAGSFLSSIPDITRTPPIVTRVPDLVEEIDKRIRSEDSRINCRSKLRELYALRDQISTRRTLPFHWDLATTIEMSAGKSNGHETGHQSPPQDIIPERRNDYIYETGSFVAVKATEQSDSLSSFWIGKVNDIIKDATGRVKKLELHWFEPSNRADVINSRYLPSSIYCATRKRRVEWKDYVLSEAVLVNFDSPTRSGHLPATVRKILLSAVPTNN